MVQLSNQLDVAVDGAVVEEDAHSDQMIRVSRAVEERNEVADRSYGALVSARQGFEGLFTHRLPGWPFAATRAFFVSGQAVLEAATLRTHSAGVTS